MSKRLQAGKDLLEKGLFEQAIKEFSIQISSSPEEIQAIYLRGVAFRKLGILDSSLKDFNKAILINPKNPDLFSDRAIVYHLMSKSEEAIADMNTSVLLDDENGFRYSCRAYMRDLLGDTNGAIEDYNKAIAGLEFPISRDGLLRGTKDKGGIDREVAMILDMLQDNKFNSEEELFQKIRYIYLSIGALAEDIPI